MNNYRLLAALRQHLTALLPLAAPPLLLNLALLVLSLAQSPNCHLATLATVLPLDKSGTTWSSACAAGSKPPRSPGSTIIAP